MVVLVICLGYVWVWGPIHNRTEKVKADLRQLGQEIQHYTTQNLHRPDWQARIKELELGVNGERQTVQQAIGQEGCEIV